MRRDVLVAVTAVALMVLGAMVLFVAPRGGDERAADRQIAPTAVPTVQPTATSAPTPVPTSTPEPQAWADLDAALAAGDDEAALAIFAQDPAAIAARSVSSFSGLDDVFADAYVARIRAFDVAVQAGDLVAAGELIEEVSAWYPERSDVTRRAAALKVWVEQSNTAQPWTGDVPHLFIHSLIIRPELAFDGDGQDAGYRTYMITRLEFTRMLDELYDNDYVLIDIHELFAAGPDGTVVETPPLVPPGKKPMIFSIDDVSYYDYMEGNGFAERVEMDAEGRVATVVVNNDGTESLTMDGDAMPILDEFVLEHPDFSMGGQKGILAVTGYEGVLGYDFSRDQTEHPEFAARRSAATEIATRMRELGWQFASHSYTHGDWLRNPQSSYSRFRFDGDNWNLEMQPVLGVTDLYISPFGYHLSNNNPRYRYLIEELGFRVFSPISDGVTRVYNDDNVVMHRIAVDGFMLGRGAARLAPYFDAAVVWDEARDTG